MCSPPSAKSGKHLPAAARVERKRKTISDRCWTVAWCDRFAAAFIQASIWDRRTPSRGQGLRDDVTWITEAQIVHIEDT
jgi:hypothetical protein